MNLPCAECRGRCCTYPVFSKAEFRRIKSVHGIPRAAIARKMQHVQSYNPKKFPQDTWGFVMFMPDGTCPYLIDGACSVYPLRPSVCRDYGVVPTLPCEYLYPEQAKAEQDKRVQRMVE